MPSTKPVLLVSVVEVLIPPTVNKIPLLMPLSLSALRPTVLIASSLPPVLPIPLLSLLVIVPPMLVSTVTC